MNNKKKIALWVIAALQFNATLYFVLVFALEGQGITLFGRPLAELGPNQGVQVLGLILGVVLGWMALLLLLPLSSLSSPSLLPFPFSFSSFLSSPLFFLFSFPFL